MLGPFVFAKEASPHAVNLSNRFTGMPFSMKAPFTTENLPQEDATAESTKKRNLSILSSQ